MYKKMKHAMLFRNSKIILISLLIWAVFSSNSLADDISFQATVDRNKATLWDTIELTLSFEGTKNVPTPDLPDINGFDHKYLGPRSQVTIINGSVSQSVSHSYILYPKQTGVFQIPAVTVIIDGTTYASSPIDVEVIDASASSPSQKKLLSAEDEPESEINNPATIEDKIFLKLELGKEKAYINEALSVVIKLYIQNLSVDQVSIPVIEERGFSLDDKFSHKEPYSQVINGLQYNVVEFYANLYPNQEGELNIGPAKIQCSILYRKTRQSSPFGRDVFGDDIFSGIFDSVQRRPIEITSNSEGLTVLPLPPEGKPENYSGAVG
ncbi:MAG: BatD family protein, partial [Candidatus Omnitrophica bacterium]|nr:BatD family protein [Candidatus Omnitrophota bacterium]